MKTTLKNRRRAVALTRTKLRLAGGVLVVVAFGLALVALELVTSPAALAPVMAAFAWMGAVCLCLGAALCLHAAGDVE